MQSSKIELRSALRVAGGLVLFVVAWFALVDVAIRLRYPEDARAPIDTRQTNSTLVDAAPNIVLYEIDRLARPAAKRLVIVGSSNAMFSMRPEDLAKDFPGFEIHNLAIPTSNMQEARQVVELAIATSDPKTLANTTFVLCTYYGIYALPQTLWHSDKSALTVEMLRYGLFRGPGDPKPILGYRNAWLTKELYRVLVGLDTLERATEGAIKAKNEGKKIDWRPFAAVRREPYRWETSVADAGKQRAEDRKRAAQIGTEGSLADAEFEVLADLVGRVKASGARLIITETPTPTWNRLNHFQFYREKKQPFVKSLADGDRVDYLDLYDAVPDALMGDSTHALRDGARAYAKAFAKAAHELPKPLE